MPQLSVIDSSNSIVIIPYDILRASDFLALKFHIPSSIQK